VSRCNVYCCLLVRVCSVAFDQAIQLEGGWVGLFGVG